VGAADIDGEWANDTQIIMGELVGGSLNTNETAHQHFRGMMARERRGSAAGPDSTQRTFTLVHVDVDAFQTGARRHFNAPAPPSSLHHHLGVGTD